MKVKRRLVLLLFLVGLPVGHPTALAAVVPVARGGALGLAAVPIHGAAIPAQALDLPTVGGDEEVDGGGGHDGALPSE